jgi:hypothetical protein
MKKFITCCILVAVLMTAQAQWKFEIVGGPSASTFLGKDKKAWGYTTKNPKVVLRGTLGFRAERAISEKFIAGGGVAYSMKGTEYSGETPYQETPYSPTITLDIKFTKMLSYIDVPVYVKFIASEKFKVLLGAQPSFLLSAKVKNNDDAQLAFQVPASEDQKDYYTSFDLAVLVGPQYQITNKFGVQLLAAPGLLKIAKGEEYDPNQNELVDKKYNVKNGAVTLQFIYSFN